MSVPVRRQFSREPYWFDDYLLDQQTRRPYDPDFGIELEADHFDQDEFLLPPPPSWFRPPMLSHFNNRVFPFNNRFGRLRRRGSIGGVGESTEVYCARGKMQVQVDVSNFAPDELNVKLVDNFLVIEGKHDEKQEGRGFISRHFVRRYEVPTSAPDFELKPEDVNCTLNTSGVLVVEVQLEPPKDEVNHGNEKLIPINMISTTTSSSSKQYSHGHSSVHVKTAEDLSTATAGSDFVTSNEKQE